MSPVAACIPQSRKDDRYAWLCQIPAIVHGYSYSDFPKSPPPQAVCLEAVLEIQAFGESSSHGKFPVDLGQTKGVARPCARDGSVMRSSTEMAQVLEEQRGNKANEKDRGRQHHGVAEGGR